MRVSTAVVASVEAITLKFWSSFRMPPTSEASSCAPPSLPETPTFIESSPTTGNLPSRSRLTSIFMPVTPPENDRPLSPLISRICASSVMRKLPGSLVKSFHCSPTAKSFKGNHDGSFILDSASSPLTESVTPNVEPALKRPSAMMEKSLALPPNWMEPTLISAPICPKYIRTSLLGDKRPAKASCSSNRFSFARSAPLGDFARSSEDAPEIVIPTKRWAS